MAKRWLIAGAVHAAVASPLHLLTHMCPILSGGPDVVDGYPDTPGMARSCPGEDSPAGSEQMEAEEARRASDWAIVQFDAAIKDFPSWEAFTTTVLSQVVPGTLGTCYTYSGGTVHVTTEPLPKEDQETGGQKTGGKGWRQLTYGRRFIEYRVNAKARILFWIEGVNPRFFFAFTQKMCEVPLEAIH